MGKTEAIYSVGPDLQMYGRSFPCNIQRATLKLPQRSLEVIVMECSYSTISDDRRVAKTSAGLNSGPLQTGFQVTPSPLDLGRVDDLP